jgi:hypothetical protein
LGGLAIELTGQRFGRLIVLGRTSSPIYGNSAWLCRCDCGVEKVFGSANLRGTNCARSCGCLKAERSQRKCSVEGCEKRHRAKGLCGPHYAKHFAATRESPPELTLERLKEVLHYDRDKGRFRRIGGARPDLIGHVADAPDESGEYPRVDVDGRRFLCHILAWFYVYGVWPEGEIDHRDGNRSNYRIKNLRDVTRRVNAQNMRKPSARNSSGYLGVSRDGPRNLWAARIRLPNGKYKYLGRFTSPERAYDAYVEAKRIYHEGCTL